MIIISFELTMPNIGSWNGRWTGEDKKFYIIRTFPSKSGHGFLKCLPNSYYYAWNDGWGAMVKVERIDIKEANFRRRSSKGFCGYDWMVDNIISNNSPYENKKEATYGL